MTSGRITREDREQAWNELQRAANENKTRPFYRAINKQGLMYAGKLHNSSTFRFKLQAFSWNCDHFSKHACTEDGFVHFL